MRYVVDINHDDEGDLNFHVKVWEAGSSQADRDSIAWALRRAADLIEKGHTVDRQQLN